MVRHAVPSLRYLRRKLQSQQRLTVCYCVARAANSVPELRQRIRDGRIIIFDHCRTSHTVALEDGTYCYCTLDGSLPFDKYLSVGKAAQERARQRRSLEEEAEPT